MSGEIVTITLELTADEAKLVVAALRRFEPYWPADMDGLDRAALLAKTREAIERVTQSLPRV